MKQIKVHLDELYPTIIDGLENDQLVELKVSGNSMYPLFRDQETTVGLRRFSGILKRRHIYLFRLDGKYFLHRYIKERSGKLCFRGDNLVRFETVSTGQVLAHVLYFQNQGSRHSPYSLWYMTKAWLHQSWIALKHILRKLVKR